MNDCLNIDNVSRLTRLAAEFGPYLFAVLLLMMTGPFAIKLAFPSFVAREENVRKLVWVWVIGTFMIIATSIIWWMASPLLSTMSSFTYRGIIYNVPAKERISPIPGDELYFIEMPGGNYQFILITNKRIYGDSKIYLSWVSSDMTNQNSPGGYGGTKLPFKFNPEQKKYAFMVKSDAAQISPID